MIIQCNRTACSRPSGFTTYWEESFMFGLVVMAGNWQIQLQGIDICWDTGVQQSRFKAGGKWSNSNQKIMCSDYDSYCAIRHKTKTSPLVLDEAVNILFFTQAQQNTTCIEAGVLSFFFTYYKVSHMGNWNVSPDLGPGCGGCFFLISLLAQRNCKNSLAGYPNIFLLWIYQRELAGDPFQSRQAQVSMRPLSFSCRIVPSRTGLQPPLPKHLRISRIVNILSPLLYILSCFHMSDPKFLCHIMDSILVIVKSRCHTKLCTALPQRERQWE